MTLNKKIIVSSKTEHKTARERLVGYLKDKWIEKKAKEEKKFEEKGMSLKVGLLDNEEL